MNFRILAALASPRGRVLALLAAAALTAACFVPKANAQTPAPAPVTLAGEARIDEPRAQPDLLR